MDTVYLGRGRLLVSLPWSGLRLIIPADDLSLTPDLALYNSWEMPLTRFLLNNVKPGQVAVDAGAHVGYFTVILAGLVGDTGQVHAFEPNPDVYPWLVDNVSINYFSKQVTLNQVGVYSKSGSATLHTYSRYSGTSTIQQPSVQRYRVDEVNGAEIRHVRLDEYLHDVDMIHMIKMDIEGSEFQAFMGLGQMLHEHRVQTVVFEWNPSSLQDDLGPLKAFLTDLIQQGFTLNLLDSSGNPTPVDPNVIFNTTEIIPYIVLTRR